ncbi:acyltransferase [Vibrio coralliilyticus]|uniref:acyltransferase n=1 Tax=Vibrio coralliilyticus TaxID=190893 RepID=UPI00155F91B3|nr:acyltransferase [Vibrio coralliilyticus]NRF27188.1 acyltransferase [Vibrio coralliilyticus]NRF81458.1 acyltransferase [Vibrio coralliilyticus]
MLKKIISQAIKIIKGREFQFDDRITNGVIVFLTLYRFMEIIRGLFWLRKLIFVGAGTRLLSTSMITCGKGVSIGRYSDIDALSEHGIVFGDGVSIGSQSVIKVSGTYTDIGHGIFVGNNVGIGDFAHIGGAGGVSIGDDTIVGAYFSIHPENHNFSDKEVLIREQGVTRKGIVIGSNCWIGAKVTVLDGSVIGDGCVVAAGAVVSGVFPNNVVIGGVPARILKERCYVQ